MGLADWIKNIRVKNVEVKESGYNSEHVGLLETPVKLTDCNANELAVHVSEIFFPIDFIADRSSKLRFFIADKNGNEVKNTELNRFISNINPIQNISDYCYDYLFSLLSDGNAFTYKQVPSSYSNTKPGIGNISRIDVLKPSKLSITEWNNISRIDILELNSLIKKCEYYEVNGSKKTLNIDLLSVANVDSNLRTGSELMAKSPLFKCVRSINNLLAVYSARYNVYANNGAAGYLVKKTGGANDVMAATSNRDDILKDINERNGLTGKKNLYGISSVPIEFINTLVTIKELMPLEETLAAAIQIAGIYQIPANLIPRNEQAKYENQAEAEKSVWENTIKSLVDVFCANTTKDLTLDKAGYSIKADYSSVSALSTSLLAKEDEFSKRIDNLGKIAAINPELMSSVTSEIDKILQYYGTK